MSQEIRAIYENGFFRPLDPVSLAEHDVVSLVVTLPGNGQNTTKEMPSGQPDEFDEELDSLLFDGPSLPADFSRADIYAERD
jgi:predicted DNA-binding antitoxin AbrB/MazE fold protein